MPSLRCIDRPHSRVVRQAIASQRRVRRLRPVGARPPPHRASVDAIGAQARHAGMVGERADLLVAGLAGNAVAEDRANAATRAAIAGAGWSR